MNRLTLQCFWLLALAGVSSSALGLAPALDETRCTLRLESMPSVSALCATLPVPLDPAEPAGPRLELFVARVPSVSRAPRPDPLVLVAGGPGQSAVDQYLQAQDAFAPVLRDRDLILLDQRGTGRSSAGFTCPQSRDLALRITEAELVSVLSRRCHAALKHDARFLTTSVAVRDLESLRRALGIEEWNLYGISYGTRVAQHYVRRYPKATRALILDGVVPTELAVGPDIALGAQRALEAVFDRCAADPKCSARFSNLRERFAALYGRLAAAPVEVHAPDPHAEQPTAHALTLVELQAVVRALSYSAPSAALLPLTIDEAYARNYQPLATLAAAIMDGLSDAVSFPMHNSIVCTEDVPFMEVPVSALAATYLGSSIVESLTALCEHWPAGAMDEDLKAPLASAHPVLVLSGEHDPVTPPAYGEQALAHGLDNAVHVVAPGQGHGLAAVGCVPRLMRAFIERPEPQGLDTACLDDEPAPPFFLSFSRPAGP